MIERDLRLTIDKAKRVSPYDDNDEPQNRSTNKKIFNTILDLFLVLTNPHSPIFLKNGGKYSCEY